MYNEYFKLHTAPFCLGPQLEFLYESDSFSMGLEHLQEMLAGPGQMCLLTGTIGTGKTLVLHSFMEEIRESHQMALVTFSKVNPLGLLKLILSDFGLFVPPRANQDQLMDKFTAFRKEVGGVDRPLVIILDEAQTLPSATLKFLPDLLQPGVKLILVGQPEVEAQLKESRVFDEDEIPSWTCKLFTLSRAEIQDYIQHRLGVAGNSGISFEGKAVDEIMHCSQGIPRVINTLANKALLAAYLEDRQKVLVCDVTSAELGDLALLPGMKNRKPLAMEAAAGASVEVAMPPAPVPLKAPKNPKSPKVPKFPKFPKVLKAAKVPKPVQVVKETPKKNSRVGAFDTVFRMISMDCPQITGLAVLTPGGEFLAKQLPASGNSEYLSKMVSSLVLVSEKVSADILDSTLRHTIIESDGGLLILAPISGGLVLALHTEEPTKLGIILMELKDWLKDLRRAVED